MLGWLKISVHISAGVGGRLFKRARKKENVKEEEVRRGME